MIVHYQKDGKDVPYGLTLCGRSMSLLTNGRNTNQFRYVTCSDCQKLLSVQVAK